MTVGKLKEILSKYNDNERILIRDFIFEHEIKDIGEQGDIKLSDDDVELVIDMWEDDLEQKDRCGELEILTSIIYDVNRDKLDNEISKIEKWLHTSSEPFDGLDWDGEELTIYNETMLDGMKISETYTRKELEEEGVI